jgi:hypothetical protein
MRVALISCQGHSLPGCAAAFEPLATPEDPPCR